MPERERERQTDRETETDRDRNRQTERQRQWQRQRARDRQSDIDRETETERDSDKKKKKERKKERKKKKKRKKKKRKKKRERNGRTSFCWQTYELISFPASTGTLDPLTIQSQLFPPPPVPLTTGWRRSHCVLNARGNDKNSVLLSAFLITKRPSRRFSHYRTNYHTVDFGNPPGWLRLLVASTAASTGPLPKRSKVPNPEWLQWR